MKRMDGVDGVDHHHEQALRLLLVNANDEDAGSNPAPPLYRKEFAR